MIYAKASSKSSEDGDHSSKMVPAPPPGLHHGSRNVPQVVMKANEPPVTQKPELTEENSQKKQLTKLLMQQNQNNM